jgi:hypothetical protein
MEAKSAAKTGALLNHVEVAYRPGERQLALALFEALGCATSDTGMMSETGSTYIAVHPDIGDQNHDNVLYLSEMPAQQVQLESLLRQRIDGDATLSAAFEDYRATASDKPFGFCHIAIRYPSFESLEPVLDGIERRLGPELKSRIRIKVYRPGDAGELGIDSLQAFIYTDVVVSGTFALGQVFELAAYR